MKEKGISIYTFGYMIIFAKLYNHSLNKNQECAFILTEMSTTQNGKKPLQNHALDELDDYLLF